MFLYWREMHTTARNTTELLSKQKFLDVELVKVTSVFTKALFALEIID